MLNTETVIKLIRPNFVFEKGDKPMQTNEVFEGSKSAAIVILVGISNLFNINKKDTMLELGISYDEYRHKLSMYQLLSQEVRVKMSENKLNLDRLNPDRVDRFYNKLMLVQNAIRLYFSAQHIPHNKIFEYEQE